MNSEAWGRRGPALTRTGAWALFALFLLPNVLGLFSHDPRWLNDAGWALIGWSGFPLVGAIILSRDPRNRVAWVMSAIGVVWAATTWFQGTNLNSHLSAAWEAVLSPFQTVAFALLLVIPLIFPTGRTETRFARVLFWVIIGAITIVIASGIVQPGPIADGDSTQRPNPLGIGSLRAVIEFIQGPSFLFVPLLLIAEFVEVGIRWRRAPDRVLRLQFAWFAFGIAVTLAILIAINGDNETDLLAIIGVAGINAIPAAMGVAITRYGLYSIGRIVSRAVSYLVVTGFAVAVYAGVVFVVSLAVPEDKSPLTVAVATLAAAAAFWPALRWFQRFIDRRFDRERYDAKRVVDAFGDRLRTGADPDTTVPELLATVEKTLQPASVGIWITPRQGGSR